MEVVSADMNSLLPEEIMDTEITLEDDDSIVAVTVSSPMGESMPMETELEVEINSSNDLTTTSTTTEPVTVTSNHTSQLTLVTPALKPDANLIVKNVFQSDRQKLSTQTPMTLSASQLILNKVSQASELKASNATVKQEGQKLIVTTKSGQPFVFTLPPGQLPHVPKLASLMQAGNSEGHTPQIKLLTIGGRSELKPSLGVSSVTQGVQLINAGAKSPALQTGPFKTVQIAKKTPVSSGAVITKLIIAKPLNSKAVTSGQATPVSSVFSGMVLSPNTSSAQPKTISISEGGAIGSTITTQSPNKIAISPLKSPNKLTVVSVASQSSNSPQKAIGVPLSMALGQQILAVQQSTSSSPAKTMTNYTTAQGVKSTVQTITVGGMNTSQFKTIIPLQTTSNVQQIQVPGSKFHYVRLVTATTANTSNQSAIHNPTTNTLTLQQAKTVVVNTTPVRMSVPIVPAQKQVAPKPICTTSQVVTTSQPQQRLIMPATQLPPIQPNLTNLPPGTVLAPAPGTGNVGYAVVPAQYVTQLQQSSYVTIASNTSFSGSPSIQTQARVPYNGIISSESANRPRKPCNCTKSLCLKLYCDCFANGEFCNNCNCTNCYNNLEHENERQKAIKACLDRNPEAFKPKIGKGKEGESDRRHSKGCNCKRSGCLKNYCECYEVAFHIYNKGSYKRNMRLPSVAG
ncbi:protein lin-54 homolog isoform X2 [Ambystoma mexicanum]|uniref:protein lin-54 homolog isoform X2 n=1 Tax=Ambystoma mexicanum TaxID=8296 RepID=UPI0037E72A0D